MRPNCSPIFSGNKLLWIKPHVFGAILSAIMTIINPWRLLLYKRIHCCGWLSDSFTFSLILIAFSQKEYAALSKRGHLRMLDMRLFTSAERDCSKMSDDYLCERWNRCLHSEKRFSVIVRSIEESLCMWRQPTTSRTEAFGEHELVYNIWIPLQLKWPNGGVVYL